jgi:tetratricopeptide (TPR) repeat protein
MRQVLTLVVALSLLATLPALAGWDEGVAAFSAKNYQEAADQFRGVVEKRPDEWRGHYMLGLSLQRLKKKEEALQHLRKAYDLNPNECSCKLALADAYMALKRHGDAAALLGSVDPASLDASHRAALYQMRGAAKLGLNDTAGAVSDLATLVRLKPDDADAQFLYGTAALRDGRTAVAVKALAAANRLSPRDADKKRAYAQALIAQGQETSDKNAKRDAYTEAARVAGELVALDASYDHRMLKVSAELGAGLYGQAIETGRAAVAQRNDDWLAYFYLGQAYSSADQYARAVAALDKAKELAREPEDLRRVWNQLGYVYEMQQDFTTSKEAYRRAANREAMIRVDEKQAAALHNQQVDDEAARLAEIEAEKARLRAELEKLRGGDGKRP